MVSIKFLLAALPLILQAVALPADISSASLAIRQDECIAPTNCGAPIGYALSIDLRISSVDCLHFLLVTASSAVLRLQIALSATSMVQL